MIIRHRAIDRYVRPGYRYPAIWVRRAAEALPIIATPDTKIANTPMAANTLNLFFISIPHGKDDAEGVTMLFDTVIIYDVNKMFGKVHVLTTIQ